MSLRLSTLRGAVQGLALTQLSEKQQKKEASHPPVHACDDAVDKSMDLFGHVYNIAAITWNEKKAVELENNPAYKAMYT
eukprot:Cvel_23938.t2-p1 / transcript=Cvel_23938.t2 / gene=Cvel_23938 / organism=Chromera_velia_CCMP2878 / gene_product=hypothetical protein / transcript_product=hypothetical protein / location=Cvel_scaffold2529:11725-11958(-) / protein_length=78 / sequence_SO=supercontig / SO=protein_coding / is_pseudo=false